MKAPTSSGIIATYNQEKYVIEAVGSLAAQVDEVVVIDDCSDDSTMNALNSLSFTNLVILRNDKNCGVSESLNRAIEASSGEYLFFSGGDDVSMPGRVQHQLETIRAFESLTPGFVFSNPLVIDSKGDEIDSNFASEFLFETTSLGLLGDLLLIGNYICAPSVAMTREAFNVTGGFHPNLLFTQDHDLWIRCLGAGFNGIRTTQPVVKYRKHPNNLSRRVARRSPEIKNLRQLAELDFLISDFLGSSTIQALQKLGEKIGHDSIGLSRSELEILVSISGNNLFAARHGFRALLSTTRHTKSTTLEHLNIDELSSRADVLSILELKMASERS